MRALPRRALDALAELRALARPRTPVPQLAQPDVALVARALGLPAEYAAEAVALAARRQLAVLRGVRRTGPGPALRRLLRACPHPLHAPAGDGAPLVLALPLTRAAVALVGGLAAAGRCVRVLRTPVAEAYLRPFLAAARDARLCTAPELLEHARGAGRGAGAVYVTFPDHYFAGAGLSRVVRFLGQDHLFPVIEAVLLGRGARLLAADVGPGEAAPSFRPCPVALAGGDALSAAELDGVAAWLAACAERVVAHDPAELLSWGYVVRHSGETVLREQVISLNNLQGFLRVWRSSGAGLPDDVFGWGVAELERLRAGAPGRLAAAPAAGGAA